MLGVGANTLSWLRYMQLELEKRDVDLGIAVVAYSAYIYFENPSQPLILPHQIFSPTPSSPISCGKQLTASITL